MRFVKVIFVFSALLVSGMDADAQCAMCRATLENNLSNGNIGIAAGINFGILYLFVAPYLFISLLAFFWYKTSRRNVAKSFDSNLAG
jgi:hypothetical protein